MTPFLRHRMCYSNKIMYYSNRFRSLSPKVVTFSNLRVTDDLCHLSLLAANGWIAEEPERWDRTSACNGELLQSLQSIFWSHLAHPDRWRHKSDGPWERGLRPLLLSNNVTGSFTSPSNWNTKMKETRPMAPRNRPMTRHQNWEGGFTASMISPVF